MMIYMLSETTIDNVLNYWFPNQLYNKFWFATDEIVDNYINTEYYYEMVNLFEYLKNQKDESLDKLTTKQLIAYIVVLDQFSRNIVRVNTKVDSNLIADMTEVASKLSYIWINKKLYQQEAINKTVFALMPLRHSYKLHDYKVILEVLEEVKDKESEIYKKFKTQTLRRYNLLN